MGMDDRSIAKRMKAIKPANIDPSWPRYAELIAEGSKPAWRDDVSKEDRQALVREWFAGLPFGKRLSFSLRPDECKEEPVRGHLGGSERPSRGRPRIRSPAWSSSLELCGLAIRRASPTYLLVVDRSRLRRHALDATLLRQI